jgi:cardiolipin synthase
MTVWGAITIVGYLITLLLLPIVFLQRKPHPESTLAWIMVIILLPYIGGLMFLIFGINRVARRTVGKEASNRHIQSHLPELMQYQLIPGEGVSPQLQRLMRLADRVARTRPSFANRIEVLADTNRTFGLIEQAIRSAKRSINLEYYIWQPDKTGHHLRDLIIEKAREGVAVRFLYDGIGSLYLGRKFLQPMRDAGIEVAAFLPGATLRERWSINLRNHRKIAIIDGQIGFTGGVNIGDEYRGRNPALGFWRDTHLRMNGPSVLQLQQVFAEDWFFATGQELTHPEWYPAPHESGAEIAQVIPGGPDGQDDVFHPLFFAAINEANEQITLSASYFVPTPALLTALCVAAYRGVRVRLMLAGTRAYRWTLFAGRASYEQLLESGCEIYEYERGLFHSKSMTVDGIWSMVGSPNFDARSLFLNFEVAVVMYGPKVALQLEEQFREDVQYARKFELERWRKRAIRHKLEEQFMRLFSPIL